MVVTEPAQVRVVERSVYIDCLRFIGALAIVWYHNSFYFFLNADDRAIVDVGKIFLCSWAMPFYYVVAVSFMWPRFAQRTWVTLRDRVWLYAKKILFFLIVYELPHAVFFVGQSIKMHSIAAYAPFGIQPVSIITGVKSFLITLMSVNHSPVYFLNHLVFLTLVVLIIRLATRYVSSRISGICIVVMIVLCLVYADYVQAVQAYIPGNVVVIVTAGLALVYEIIMSQRVQKFSVPHAGTVGALLSMVTMFAIGYLQWLHVSWYMVPAVFFLYLRDSLDIPGQGFFKKIAHLGRAYSFGIFAWHYFFLIVFAAIAKSISFPQYELAIFISTTILGVLMCMLWVMVCYRVSWLRWMVVL